MDAEMSLGPTTTSSASIELFRSRSDKLNLDPRVDPHWDSYEEPLSSPSSSWFSTIFSERRKKRQSRMFYMDMKELAVGERRSCKVVNRGMSPVRSENTEDEGDDRATYGSSQEASPRWRCTSQPLRIGDKNVTENPVGSGRGGSSISAKEATSNAEERRMNGQLKVNEMTCQP
ncbi:hypothetical protein SLEP1_g19294 [Rubroshorea leprosula]|nr:hypothetical protein SLEP1_g19294 [Rubroshorea leprosula]